MTYSPRSQSRTAVGPSLVASAPSPAKPTTAEWVACVRGEIMKLDRDEDRLIAYAFFFEAKPLREIVGLVLEIYAVELSETVVREHVRSFRHRVTEALAG